jgi:hypothetical protein
VSNGTKLNVFAKNHTELEWFMRENGVNRSLIRHIDSVINLYGQWQGSLTVLPGASERPDAARIIEEARRRGMTVVKFGEKE